MREKKMSEGREIMDKVPKTRKWIKFSTTKVFKNFGDHDLTLEGFTEWLIKEKKITKSGAPITKAYAYTLLCYGHLPKHMGGNKLYISMVRDTVCVKVTDKIHDFNKNSGKVLDGQAKRGPKRVKPKERKTKLLFKYS